MADKNINELNILSSINKEDTVIVSSNGKLSRAKIDTIVGDTADDLITLKNRVDNLAELEEGSTTGDAELIDIRVGADGKKYNSAGEAVRGQVENLDKKVTAVDNTLYIALTNNIDKNVVMTTASNMYLTKSSVSLSAGRYFIAIYGTTNLTTLPTTASGYAHLGGTHFNEEKTIYWVDEDAKTFYYSGYGSVENDTTAQVLINSLGNVLATSVFIFRVDDISIDYNGIITANNYEYSSEFRVNLIDKQFDEIDTSIDEINERIDNYEVEDESIAKGKLSNNIYKKFINIIPQNKIVTSGNTIYIVNAISNYTLEAGHTYMFGYIGTSGYYQYSSQGYFYIQATGIGRVNITDNKVIKYLNEDKTELMYLGSFTTADDISSWSIESGSLFSSSLVNNAIFLFDITNENGNYDYERILLDGGYQYNSEYYVFNDIEFIALQDRVANAENEIAKIEENVDVSVTVDCWGDSHTGGGSGAFHDYYANVEKYDEDGTLNENGLYVRYMNEDGTFTFELAAPLRHDSEGVADEEGEFIRLTANTSYPKILQRLINENNSDIVVNNAGQGGEKIKGTSARMGAYPLVLQPCTIPAATLAGGYVYNNGDSTQKFIAEIISPIKPLDKGSHASSADMSSALTLALGDRLVGIFKEQEDGIWICDSMQRLGDYRNEIIVKYPVMLKCPEKTANINIIMIGTNCGFHTIDDLINTLLAMVDHSEKYIIVSDPGTGGYLPLGNLDKLSDDYAYYDAELTRLFGRHYLRAYELQIKYGLMYNGLSDSVYDGNTYPPQIKGGINGDVGVHYTQYGNNSLAYWIYQRGKELGYWK